MARVEIKITGTAPGKRTEINVERFNEVAAVSEAITLLISSYGPDLRRVVDEIRTAVRFADEFLGRQTPESVPDELV